MTEDEWLVCEKPDLLLRHLHRFASNRAWVRRMRLLVCACSRLVWDLIPIPEDRAAIGVAERFADGEADLPALAAAREASALAKGFSRTVPSSRPATWATSGSRLLLDAAQQAVASVVRVRTHRRMGPEGHLRPGVEWKRCQSEERVALCQPIRDIFEGLVRHATVNGQVAGPDAAPLAAGAYDHREMPSGQLDPARFAVLSDALEEAGCADADLLAHLRSPGPHVRGCWALDLVLGKE